MSYVPGKYRRLRGAKWLAAITRVRARDPLCATCKALGVVTLGVEMDHVVPLHKGGSNDDDNLQMLCVPCHRKKTRDELGLGQSPGFDEQGNPLDESSSWYIPRS